MFQTSELQEMQFFDGNTFLGMVRYNPNISFKIEMTRPFIRCGKREILSIGRVNFQFLDQFIMQSLNDIYAHINEGKKEEIIRKNISEYQELYALWQKIALAKQNRDIAINSYYDDLLYRLYLKGYHN